MRTELPFRLKVGGTDAFQDLRAIRTSFRFDGWLRLDGASLHVEWSGYARRHEVRTTSVRDQRLPLPTETLLLPVGRLRRADLLGGWWRPRLRVSARDDAALRAVPSEANGAVQFWYARGDRLLAAALAADLTRAIAAAEQLGEGSEEMPYRVRSAPEEGE